VHAPHASHYRAFRSIFRSLAKGVVTSYLEVITAPSAPQADEVTAVDILGRRMANTVLLIQALGGGWDAIQFAGATRMLPQIGEQRQVNSSI
jgi:outer membrane protein TolC